MSVCVSLHGFAQEMATGAPPVELEPTCGVILTAGASTAGNLGEHAAASVAQFLAGAAIGLGIHEGGHATAAALFGASPGVKGIRYGTLPFFAVTHRAGLSPGREFTVSAAGLWAEQAASELILSRRPGLREERAPVAKGILAFHVLSSVVYAVAGFARTGPPERDTRSMAAASGISERWIGAAVLAPAVFDAWRYFRPRSRAARWAARTAKAGGILLAISS